MLILPDFAYLSGILLEQMFENSASAIIWREEYKFEARHGSRGVHQCHA
jgi:hypothetical protein